MWNPRYDVLGGSRGPLFVLAVAVAAGLALLVVVHRRGERAPRPATSAAAPLTGGDRALPVSAPVPAR